MLKEEYGNRIELTYKTFPLAPNPEMISLYFRSAKEGKREILKHWAQTKLHPGGELINPELMATRDFDYPYSMPGLVACKCAEEELGPEGHEKMKNLLQYAHLVACRNLNDPDVVFEMAGKINLNMNRFTQCCTNHAMISSVMDDYNEALQLGIRGTPAVLFPDGTIVRGAVHINEYQNVVNRLTE